MSDKKTDLGVPVIQIFIKSDNQLSWHWRGVSGKQVEQILLDAFRGQVEYNVKQKAKQPAIVKPTLSQIVGVNN